jgi:aryl-alcohol dehydrogenase-like predicted oxidoreductase
MIQTTRATAEGTALYKDRFSNHIADGLADGLAEGHFRQSNHLWLSSIGLGTYLGDADDRTDQAYRMAVRRAVELGCNVIDTAANYRFQRSERSIGGALADLFSQGEISRDEIVVATKGGYIPFNDKPPLTRQDMMRYIDETFIETGICEWSDFVQNAHCITPRYLAHQLDQSLENLKLDCIDVYYIHNPESQLSEVSREEFYQRLRKAFEFLEGAVEAGKISTYGTATWNGYRAPSGNQNSREFLSIEQVVNTAQEVAGAHHHFKVVQLPVNLGMLEAFTDLNQPLKGGISTFLEAAVELGITVMSSASILQSKLASGLGPVVSETFKGLRTDAQRAIQFTRSTPGVTTALVGMSNVSHVEENMEVGRIPPAELDDYLKLFSTP